MLVVILFVLSFGIFYSIASLIEQGREINLDIIAYRLLLPVTSPLVTKFMTVVTFFGSSHFLVPAYTVLVAYFLFIKRNTLFAIGIVLTGFLGNQLLFLMQYIFHRHRPPSPLIDYVAGYSFPSGHSFAAFTFSGLLAYIFWQTQLQKVWKIVLSVICFIIAALIATSRVYLHIHYASDVLGGFCLSIMWLFISILLLHKAGNGYRHST